MKKKQIKRKKVKTTARKTAAVFNNAVLKSNDMFLHCSRIPDVMNRTIRAREILKRYRIKPPAWMFGLAEKGEVFSSPVHLRLMSFLISVGLYDRLIRKNGAPDFLIGSSQALLVSARIKTFEKSVIKLFCGWQLRQDGLRVYQKKPNGALRFSLLHFSESIEEGALQKMAKKHKVGRCILISPSSYSAQQKNTVALKVESLIEKDSQLSWFWPVLRQKQLMGKPGAKASVDYDRRMRGSKWL